MRRVLPSLESLRRVDLMLMRLPMATGGDAGVGDRERRLKREFLPAVDGLSGEAARIDERNPKP
jgi:hypothetical protein